MEKESAFHYKCSYCDKTYLTQVSFRKHLLDEHLQPNEDKIAKKKLKLELKPKKAPKIKPEFYACEICGKKVKKKERLNDHMLSHAPANIECVHCDKKFKTKSNLIQHLKGDFFLCVCVWIDLPMFVFVLFFNVVLVTIRFVISLITFLNSD